MQKCNYNDEPVARYYNHQLTPWMERFMGEPLLHPGLALTIWIMSGTYPLLLSPPLHPPNVPSFTSPSTLGTLLTLTNTCAGEGFPMHMDSVPPFDLTLDLVVDHFGPSHRPVSMVRPNSRILPTVTEDTLSLEVLHHHLSSLIFVLPLRQHSNNNNNR